MYAVMTRISNDPVIYALRVFEDDKHPSPDMHGGDAYSWSAISIEADDRIPEVQLACMRKPCKCEATLTDQERMRRALKEFKPIRIALAKAFAEKGYKLWRRRLPNGKIVTRNVMAETDDPEAERLSRQAAGEPTTER